MGIDLSIGYMILLDVSQILEGEFTMGQDPFVEQLLSNEGKELLVCDRAKSHEKSYYTRWRSKHKDRYNEYSREYRMELMKKYPFLWGFGEVKG